MGWNPGDAIYMWPSAVLCGEISDLSQSPENSWPAWTLLPLLASSEGRPIAGHGRCSRQCLGAIERPLLSSARKGF